MFPAKHWESKSKYFANHRSLCESGNLPHFRTTKAITRKRWVIKWKPLQALDIIIYPPPRRKPSNFRIRFHLICGIDKWMSSWKSLRPFHGNRMRSKVKLITEIPSRFVSWGNATRVCVYPSDPCKAYKSSFTTCPPSLRSKIHRYNCRSVHCLGSETYWSISYKPSCLSAESISAFVDAQSNHEP